MYKTPAQIWLEEENRRLREENRLLQLKLNQCNPNKEENK